MARSATPIKTSNGLDHPFPRSHTTPAKHVIYATRPGEVDRGMAILFSADYAAAHFVATLIGSSTFEWEETPTWQKMPQLLTSSNVRLRSDHLDQLVAYEFTETERQWSLPEGYSRMARSFRFVIIARPETENDDEPEGNVDRPASKEPKVKIDRSAKVSIQAIAEELTMTPKEARTILRKLNVQKPEGGWLFDPTEINALKKKLLDNRK
jgi:hypothetical protein